MSKDNFEFMGIPVTYQFTDPDHEAIQIRPAVGEGNIFVTYYSSDGKAQWMRVSTWDDWQQMVAWLLNRDKRDTRHE